jgi:hypothetical protein
MRAFTAMFIDPSSCSVSTAETVRGKNIETLSDGNFHDMFQFKTTAFIEAKNT